VARDSPLAARHIALTGETRRGLEADQKVIAAHGCYAMTATTALTAQNTRGVFGIHETPTAFVRQQIEAVVEDVGVDVVKTGIDYWIGLMIKWY
jgi:hydroxymethylpyrimidine/phosphomethylpyrimidine kinase